MALHSGFDSTEQKFLEAAGPPKQGQEAGGLCRGPQGIVDTEVGPMSGALGPWEGEDIPCFPCKVEGGASKEKKPGFWGGQYVGTGSGKPSSGKQSGRPP